MGSTERLACARDGATVAVWDVGVRLFHAALALCVAVAGWIGFFGPANALNLHLAAGVAAGALVFCRFVWGFFGPTYARFASFVLSPEQVLARAREILNGRRTRYLGHNPLGGAMVAALLAAIFAMLLTGTVALGGVDKQGPLAFATPYAVGKLFRRAHEWLAYTLLILIVVHLVGVAFETLIGREKLVAAMATGRKPAHPESVAFAERGARPWAALAIIGCGLALAAIAAARLAARPALGVPTEPIDPTYARECGSCHMAFPPSLAPRARWRAIVAGLADHFGEDASLDAPTSARILAYLDAHAAETADTRAANELRRPGRDEPLRLTAAPYWRRVHAGIAEPIFKLKAVGAQSACDACHRDAAGGRFDPQSIAIPETGGP